MKIDFTAVLKDKSGALIKEPDGREIILSTPCINALYSTFEEDKNLSGEEKYKRYQLAQKLDQKEPVELSAEEISVIKKYVGKGFNPFMVGIIYDILEGK